METTSKKASLKGFIDLYGFHTKLFANAIDGISDEDAGNRLNTKANHVAWIAGSLVQQRYLLANILGINDKPSTDVFASKDWGIQDNIAYPPLVVLKKDWDHISPLLKDALDNLSEEQLNGPDPFGMPGENITFFDSLTFVTHREPYCIGQIALYRRLLGYDAMKYD